MGKRLILSSFGLTSKKTRSLIKKELQKDINLSEKKIYLFFEPYYSIEGLLVEACLNIGFRRENILLSTEVRPEDIEEIKKVDYIYVTEGNTFEIAALLKDRGIDEVIREAFKNGATYSGASAGAMLAGESIEEALLFDRNEVGLKDYKGLCLMDGIVIPH